MLYSLQLSYCYLSALQSGYWLHVSLLSVRLFRPLIRYSLDIYLYLEFNNISRVYFNKIYALLSRLMTRIVSSTGHVLTSRILDCLPFCERKVTDLVREQGAFHELCLGCWKLPNVTINFKAWMSVFSVAVTSNF